MSNFRTATCTTRDARCGIREQRRKRSSLGARLAAYALAVVAIYAMFSGERWMLQHSPPATDPLIVATCAVDVVFGDTHSENACTSAQARVQKEKENAR